MITFKNYITEARKSLEELEHEVDSYLKDGEILNPQWNDLKSQVDRHVREVGEEEINKPHFWGKGNEIFTNNPEDGDALYDLHGPDSIRQVGMIPKRIAKVKKVKDHPIVKANNAFYEKYKDLAEKMAKLKTMVVKVSEKRAQKKEQEAKAFQKTYSDSSSLVKVLEQHIDEYVARAEKMAAQQFDSLMNVMKEHGWDLDVVAPAPTTKMGREVYKSASQKRAFFMGLTDAVGSPTGPHRKLSTEKRKHFIESAGKSAHASYMAWVHKMIQKIGGAVKSAEMHGSPWTGATLNVTKNDGETQKWVAKMIINRSKYNTLFNQFPTRRVDKPDSLEEAHDPEQQYWGAARHANIDSQEASYRTQDAFLKDDAKSHRTAQRAHETAWGAHEEVEEIAKKLGMPDKQAEHRKQADHHRKMSRNHESRAQA